MFDRPARPTVSLAFAVTLSILVATVSAEARSAPTAPTRDQRALKVLAEARDLVAAGRSNESIPFYGHALDMAEAETNEPSVALANLLAEYGDVLRRSGHANRARSSLQRSLEMLESLLEPGDSQLAQPLLALGRLDAGEGKCLEAEERLTRGLELLGDGPREAVSARVALGSCSEMSGGTAGLDTAFGHYRTAVLAAREASLETAEVATALHRGASILLTRNEAGRAVVYFEQALSLRRSLLGESHWHTAETAHRLALALDRQGRTDDARSRADEAVGALGRACAPSNQSPSEIRQLCSDLAALRRRLSESTSRQAPPPEARATAPAPAEPQTRFRAQTEAAPSGQVWRVQVSSRQSPAAAERFAEQVRNRFDSLLRGHQLTIERADLPSGVWHRVLFGAFRERSGAVALCESLKRNGMDECLPSPSE
ncbi:MAG: tetratricopeptide repeat protein [Thermoanaerobaculia bacterium]|nr:tetratricopeptide repeat protein [Thermoanaerobaculia bacterium]